MSLLHKNVIELLTEGQYTTVSVYFQTKAEYDSVAANIPQAAAPAPKAGAWATNQASRRTPAPWEESRWAPLDVAQFPFISNEIPAHLYTYKVSLELGKLLKQGDLVVVPSGRTKFEKFAVAKVWQVHATAQIDYEAGLNYSWIVQLVDTSQFNDHMQREATFRAMLTEAKKAEERAAIRASVLASMQPGTDGYDIFAQALGVLGVEAPAPITPPPAPPMPPAPTAKK